MKQEIIYEIRIVTTILSTKHYDNHPTSKLFPTLDNHINKKFSDLIHFFESKQCH